MLQAIHLQLLNEAHTCNVSVPVAVCTYLCVCMCFCMSVGCFLRVCEKALPVLHFLLHFSHLLFPNPVIIISIIVSLAIATARRGTHLYMHTVPMCVLIT